MGNVFRELKRRNVFRVGVGYLVLAWLILQIGSVLAPILGLPESALSFVVFALVLGFPLALLFAWAYELTPDGLKRSGDVAPEVSVTTSTGKRLNVFITGTMGLVIALLLVDRFVFSDQAPTQQAVDKKVVLGERTYESIAVLPFVNMSEDKSQEFFSDGISEELLNLLAKTRGLRVAARTSSFAFKGKNQNIKNIGEQLDVETVLEGSVRKADTKLRITAQLIDVESGFHLWSETYDRELTDVFAVQDEISAAIVSALAVHLDGVASAAPKSSAGDVKAFEEYLKGRERIGLRTRADIEAADAHFKAAVEIDPDYAPPWAGRADAIMLLSDNMGAYGEMPVNYSLELARPMIDRALQLDPDLPDAHNSLGFVLDLEGRTEEALESFNRALELRPSFPIALMWKASVLRDINRWGEAGEALGLAHRLDPLSYVILLNLVNHDRDRYDLAAIQSHLRKAKQVFPERLDRHKFIEGAVYTLQGDLSSAYGAHVESAELGTDQSVIGLSFACLAMKNRDCIKVPFPPFRTFVFVAYGEIEEARVWMDGYEANFGGTAFFKYQRLLVASHGQDYAEAERLADELAAGNPYSEYGPLFDRIDEPSALRYLLAKDGVGDQEAVAEMLSTLERYVQRLEEEGNGKAAMFTRAVLGIYRGDHDGAMEILKEARGDHLLTWSSRNDPLFARLSGREDFEALFDDVDAHINKERAELGWGLMEILVEEQDK